MSIPSGYRRVEYLESVFEPRESITPTNHPYIEISSLGNVPFKKGEYKLKMRRYDNGEMRLMGFGNNTVRHDYGYSCCNVVGGSSDIKNVAYNYGGNWIDTKSTTSYIGTDIDVDYIFEEGKQAITLNGTIYPLVGPSTLNFSWGTHVCTGFYLFRVNDQMYLNDDGTKSGRMRGSARIYYAQVYNDGILVADLVPVAKGTIGYMYDFVSDKVFGAVEGSGQFICGEDVICKFKDSTNQQLCKAIYGYCQFQEDGYKDGSFCPIKDAYKDLIV